MNSEGVYETEFDVLKQIEISDQLRILKNAMGFVSDLMIVSPDHDQVITTQGWYSLRDYSRFYQNKASCETDGNALSVAAADGIRSILLRDINSRLHKGYACILVDAPAFAKYADSVRSELITGVRIEVDGALWYADEKVIQDAMAITVRKYGLPQTTFTIYSPTYVSSLLPTRLFSLLFELIVTSLFLVLAAYLFTLINTRPVARLLQRFSQDDHRSVNEAVNYINEGVCG